MFLLHIPCWVHFYRGSFSYTSLAGFIFIWVVSLTHPVLVRVFFFFFFLIWGVTHPMFDLLFCGEFLLHIPCWLFFFFFYLESFTYTSRVGFTFLWGVSRTHPLLTSFFMWGVSLTHPVLAFFFFLSFFNYLGNFSYTSCAGFIFIWGVSLTHPFFSLFFSFFYFYLGSFSYTSHVGFNFLWGVSLTDPVLSSFF